MREIKFQAWFKNKKEMKNFYENPKLLEGDSN